MASIFKILREEDKTTIRTNLYENITITGSIQSGTYNDENIKNFSHGMMQKVYDYPYLSSSANEIYDITAILSNNSTLSGSSAGHKQIGKKINIYNSLAQVLMGNDVTGNIREFDRDGNLADGGDKIREAFVVNFARLLTKDEIKKGTFRLEVYADGPGNVGGGANLVTFGDYGASTDYKVNSPAGEYGILYTGSDTPNSESGRGLIFYQAGVAILTASAFTGTGGASDPTTNFFNDGTESGTIDYFMSGVSISTSADGLRRRINNIQFNNTTEVNSQVMTVRLGSNEFNYSSNPTYTSGSKIVVKNQAGDQPAAYFTGVGLYSADNELLAFAKLSEPIKKTPGESPSIRVRLDF